jgi:type II secretory pathway component PulL
MIGICTSCRKMLADMAPVEKQQSFGLQDTEDGLASKLTALDLVNMSSFKFNCSDYCNKIKTLKPMIRSNNQSGLQLSQHHERSKHRRSPVNDRPLNLISRFVFIETYMIS